MSRFRHPGESPQPSGNRRRGALPFAASTIALLILTACSGSGEDSSSPATTESGTPATVPVQTEREAPVVRDERGLNPEEQQVFAELERTSRGHAEVIIERLFAADDRPADSQNRDKISGVYRGLNTDSELGTDQSGFVSYEVAIDPNTGSLTMSVRGEYQDTDITDSTYNNRDFGQVDLAFRSDVLTPATDLSDLSPEEITEIVEGAAYDGFRALNTKFDDAEQINPFTTDGWIVGTRGEDTGLEDGPGLYTFDFATYKTEGYMGAQNYSAGMGGDYAFDVAYGQYHRAIKIGDDAFILATGIESGS